MRISFAVFSVVAASLILDPVKTIDLSNQPQVYSDEMIAAQTGASQSMG